MEVIILHPKNKEQLSVFKKLFKTMDVPFETKEEEEIVVGYDANGKPFTVSEHKKNIQQRIDDVRNGKAKIYSPEQVLNKILKK